jgi:23S rRNA A2030 N6-methylase RlmJ
LSVKEAFVAYDHSRKAGNLGDVWKHAVLVSTANHLEVGSDFRYIETHSGAPVHHLRAGGERRRGIGGILDQVDEKSHPYLRQAKLHMKSNTYPSGWLFFATAMSQRINSLAIDLCDTSSDVADQYRCSIQSLMPPNAKGVFHKKDGYAFLEDVDADLVFLDPPFAPDDWGRLSRTCCLLKQKKVPFLAWYPIFWPTKPTQLVNETSLSGFEVMWREFGQKPCQNMKGCGMLMSDALEPVIESARPGLEEVARHMGSAGILVRRAQKAF